MPSDHHFPRLSQSHHVVMHHRSRTGNLLGHFQSVHPVATPPLACCPGLRNLTFVPLQPHRTTRMQTRKRPRRPGWKRSRVANRRTSCCAVSHLSIVTRLFRKQAQIHHHIGTVLDADGTPFDHTLMIIYPWRAYHAWFYELASNGASITDDVPRGFLPPPCEAHAPPTFRSGPVNRLNYILASLPPCYLSSPSLTCSAFARERENNLRPF